MATIASLAVQLSVNASEATKNLETFGGTVRTLGKTAAQGAGLVGAAFESMINIAKGIPLIGGLFAAVPLSIKSFVDVIKDGINEMLAMSKAAKRLGVSVESLAAIQYASGGATEGIERGLFRFQAMLGAANTGVEEAQGKFAKLGLSWQELNKLPLDIAFAKVNDRLQELGNTATAKYAAFTLFGKTGFEIVGKSSRLTTEALEAARKKLVELGATFSDADVGSLARAKKAFRDLDVILTNLKRNLAIEFAPILGTISEAFADWVKSGGNLRETFRNMAKGMGQILATILEAIAELVDEVKALVEEVARLKGVGNAINRVNPVAQIMGQVGTLLAPSEGAAAGGGQQQTGIRRFIAQLRNPDSYGGGKAAGLAGLIGAALKNQQAIAEAAALAQQAINDKGAALATKLSDEIEAFGKSTHAIEINKLAREGLDQAIVAGLRKQQAQLDALKVWQETLTPLEKFYKRLEELQALVDSGEMGWQTYSRAVSAAGDALLKADKLNEVKFAPLALEGSQEAYKIQLQNQMGKQTMGDLLREAIERSTEEEARITDNTRSMLDELRNLNRGLKVG